MHILIGLGVAVVLLYFWLIGHWFARVLVFLMLALAFGAAGAALIAAGFEANQQGAKIGGAIFGGAIGVMLAWFSSGIPIYYWRHQLRALG